MHLREPTTAEADRVSELVESAMTTSFRLSPEQIQAIVREQFGEDALTRKLDSRDTILRVVETEEDVEEPTIVGIVEGTLEEPWGELNWLFVDPEHRGRGLGTQLYETAEAILRDRGAEGIRATVLEANTEGHQFFDQFGLERVGERRVDVGDESLVKYVFADPSASVETAADVTDAETDETGLEGTETGGEDAEEIDPAELPSTETHGGTTTATTEDGQRAFIDLDDRESGTEGLFFVAYADEDHDERFGYYCSNCGSLDTSMDSMDRIECQNCGNSHASRSDEAYDDSYL